MIGLGAQNNAGHVVMPEKFTMDVTNSVIVNYIELLDRVIESISEKHVRVLQMTFDALHVRPSIAVDLASVGNEGLVEHPVNLIIDTEGARVEPRTRRDAVARSRQTRCIKQIRKEDLCVYFCNGFPEQSRKGSQKAWRIKADDQNLTIPVGPEFHNLDLNFTDLVQQSLESMFLPIFLVSLLSPLLDPDSIVTRQKRFSLYEQAKDLQKELKKIWRANGGKKLPTQLNSKWNDFSKRGRRSLKGIYIFYFLFFSINSRSQLHRCASKTLQCK